MFLLNFLNVVETDHPLVLRLHVMLFVKVWLSQIYKYVTSTKLATILFSLIGIPGPFQGLWQKNQGGGGTTWKTTVWEGGHRVPAIVSWPRVITKGRVSDSIISALDILPTLSSLVGFNLPSDRHYDGVDVSDVLLFNKQRSEEVIFHLLLTTVLSKAFPREYLFSFNLWWRK